MSHIHCPVNSSDECKFLGYFGSRCAKIRPTKDCGHNPANKRKFNRHHNHSLDKIIPQENSKLSAEAEVHDNIESEIDYNDLYQIDNMSIDDKKEKYE